MATPLTVQRFASMQRIPSFAVQTEPVDWRLPSCQRSPLDESATTMLGYRFSSHGAELHIEHPRIERVVIEVEPFAMVVRGPRSVAATLAADGSEEDPPARFGLTELHGAVQCIRERIETRGWRAPVLPRTVLPGHLLAERERGLAEANPAAHAVERAVLRVTRRLPRLAA